MESISRSVKHVEAVVSTEGVSAKSITERIRDAFVHYGCNSVSGSAAEPTVMNQDTDVGIPVLCSQLDFVRNVASRIRESGEYPDDTDMKLN